MSLNGKVSLITGSGQGIGKAIALAFAKEGSDIIVNVRKSIGNAESTAKEIRDLGRHVLVCKADVTNFEEVRNMVESVIKSFGKIDILVNNPGPSIRKPFEEITEEEWKNVVDVNLNGVFICSHLAGKKMISQKEGNIINIASASAHRCLPLGGAYGPAKAAVVSLTKQLALEWAKHNIKVNGISPGPVMTKPSEVALLNDELKRRINNIPMSRTATPNEIANVAVFLASDNSSYITGQTIIVVGGGSETWYLFP